MDIIKIGAFIATMRKSLGLTQLQLSEKLSISNKVVSKWERGASYPDITLIPALCEILGITIDELLNGARISKDNVEISASSNIIDEQIKYLSRKTFVKYRNVNFICWGAVILGLIIMSIMSIIVYSFSFGNPPNFFLVFVTLPPCFIYIVTFVVEAIMINNIVSSFKYNTFIDVEYKKAVYKKITISAIVFYIGSIIMFIFSYGLIDLLINYIYY